jgi:hypothetical protein
MGYFDIDDLLDSPTAKNMAESDFLKLVHGLWRTGKLQIYDSAGQQISYDQAYLFRLSTLRGGSLIRNTRFALVPGTPDSPCSLEVIPSELIRDDIEAPNPASRLSARTNSRPRAGGRDEFPAYVGRGDQISRFKNMALAYRKG